MPPYRGEIGMQCHDDRDPQAACGDIRVQAVSEKMRVYKLHHVAAHGRPQCQDPCRIVLGKAAGNDSDGNAVGLEVLAERSVETRIHDMFVATVRRVHGKAEDDSLGASEPQPVYALCDAYALRPRSSSRVLGLVGQRGVSSETTGRNLPMPASSIRGTHSKRT